MRLLRSYESVNATLGWLVFALLVVATIDQARSGEYLWAGMAASIVALSLLPVVVSRSLSQMLPWEVLAITAAPVLAHWAGLAMPVTAYLAVAGLALVVAVELDQFTDVEMTPAFAVGFVVVVTMGVAGLWTITQYALDVFLDTSLLTTQRSVMWDLIGATTVGVVAGVVFELYVRRVSPGHAAARTRWRGD